MQLKIYFFVPSCPSMYASQLWCYFRKPLHAKIADGLQFWLQNSNTTCPGERVLVVIRCNVTFSGGSRPGVWEGAVKLGGTKMSSLA